MMVNFSAKNYKSFSSEVNPISQGFFFEGVLRLPSQAFKTVTNGLNILLAAAICGANASGKSNLVDAMAMMKFHIHTSLAKDNVLDKIPGRSISVVYQNSGKCTHRV